MVTPPLSAKKIPTAIHLHRHSKELELVYASSTPGADEAVDKDQESYRLSCEYLRVHSPSAEVRGHGKGQEVLQVGKKYVNIQKLTPTGNYAIQITFDDGHDTGIYAWDYLYTLCIDQEHRWNDYLQRLNDAGAKREPDSQPVFFKG